MPLRAYKRQTRKVLRYLHLRCLEVSANRGRQTHGSFLSKKTTTYLTRPDFGDILPESPAYLLRRGQGAGKGVALHAPSELRLSWCGNTDVAWKRVLGIRCTWEKGTYPQRKNASTGKRELLYKHHKGQRHESDFTHLQAEAEET